MSCAVNCSHISSLHTSVIWYRRVTVPMVDIDGSSTLIIQLKYVSIAMIPPPGTKLVVPTTGQGIKQLRVLHADHGEEILVTQVAPEAILVCKFSHVARLQQLVVEGRCSHRSEVQKHHAAIEAWESIRRRFTYFGLRVLLTVLPEGVSEGGRVRKFMYTCVRQSERYYL